MQRSSERSIERTAGCSHFSLQKRPNGVEAIVFCEQQQAGCHALADPGVDVVILGIRHPTAAASFQRWAATRQPTRIKEAAPLPTCHSSQPMRPTACIVL